MRVTAPFANLEPSLHRFSSQKHIIPSLPEKYLFTRNEKKIILDQPTTLRHADVVHHEEVDVNLVSAGPPDILVSWVKI